MAHSTHSRPATLSSSRCWTGLDDRHRTCSPSPTGSAAADRHRQSNPQCPPAHRKWGPAAQVARDLGMSRATFCRRSRSLGPSPEAFDEETPENDGATERSQNAAKERQNSQTCSSATNRIARDNCRPSCRCQKRAGWTLELIAQRALWLALNAFSISRLGTSCRDGVHGLTTISKT